MQVNRTLPDEMMDRIDHAIGRPFDPLSDTYRNHYYTGPGDPYLYDMLISPYWEVCYNAAPGEMRWLAVTQAGREALSKYLKDIGDKHRKYLITYRGHTSEVISTSSGRAKYAYFLDLTDARPDITFKDFCKHSRCVVVR